MPTTSACASAVIHCRVVAEAELPQEELELLVLRRFPFAVAWGYANTMASRRDRSSATRGGRRSRRPPNPFTAEFSRPSCQSQATCLVLSS